MQTPKLTGLNEIAPRYDVILCDVWGVLHNGKRHWPGAVEALCKFRQQGGIVIMITNSPKPSQAVVQQFHAIGVPTDGLFDAIVSSGDTTQNLIRQVEGKIYFLGPERDLILFDGLNIEFGQIEDAAAVVCTGLLNDEEENPEDYRELLQSFADQELPFICANPDIIVERGEKMIWCAGALARDYNAMGGEVRLVGKPHTPIYERAIEMATAVCQSPMDQARILAIGDGMPTDVKGAHDFGLDLLYVSAGIHAHEYGDPENPVDSKLQKFLFESGAHPVAYIPRLIW